MKVFFQQCVTGISIGSVYALLAVGYALIYSIYNFTNFAFGSFMMVGAWAGYLAMSYLKLPFIFGILFSIIIGVGVSLLTETVAYRTLLARGASRMYLMITAMGINIFITQLCAVVLGTHLKNIQTEWSTKTLSIFGATIGLTDVLALILSLVFLAGLWVFIYMTKPGLAIRASAHDTSAAALMGINQNAVSIIVFSISGVVAGLSGLFFGMKYAVYSGLGSSIGTKCFIAGVLGGFGSLPGAVVGGLLLGLLETLVAGYISSAYRDLFSYLVLILVLLFLPNGIMGKDIRDKM